jgi:hypothetical protein
VRKSWYPVCYSCGWRNHSGIPGTMNLTYLYIFLLFEILCVFKLCYRSSNVPARTSSTYTQPAPHHAPPQQPVVVQQQPGLLKQMAATAGGVAVGSAVVSYSTVHSYLLK